jgi:hypothetical protein
LWLGTSSSSTSSPLMWRYDLLLPCNFGHLGERLELEGSAAVVFSFECGSLRCQTSLGLRSLAPHFILGADLV